MSDRELVDRPLENEYNPFYAGYIARVPNGKVFDRLNAQIERVTEAFGDLSDDQADFRPAPQEWSPKEILGHMIDAERVMAYRALCISRGEMKPLPGFDQDSYVQNSDFKDRQIDDLIEEFELIRAANILAFNRITPERSLRTGNANGSPISLRALLYIMAGHVEHHLESLRMDYLPKMSSTST